MQNTDALLTHHKISMILRQRESSIFEELYRGWPVKNDRIIKLKKFNNSVRMQSDSYFILKLYLSSFVSW